MSPSIRPREAGHRGGPAGLRDLFEQVLKRAPFPVVLVEGGVTRKESVAAAFAASGATGDEFLCVHDAARPIVDPVEVAAVIDAAAETGAAVAAYSLIETIKLVEGEGREDGPPGRARGGDDAAGLPCSNSRRGHCS